MPLMFFLKSSIFSRNLLCEDLSNFRLTDREMIRILQYTTHRSCIFLLIRLCAQRMNRRSLGFIQHLRLDKRFINIFAHLTAEGIQLLDAPCFSVQYHPEASPGPTDAHYLFTAFTRLMDGEENYLDIDTAKDRLQGWNFADNGSAATETEEN